MFQSERFVGNKGLSCPPPLYRRRIVCAHQGCELYGSDRIFVEVVKAFRKVYPRAIIVVLLPSPGPIEDALRQVECEIVYDKIWVLRRYGLLSSLLKAPLAFPRRIAEGLDVARDADILYVSTIVILSLLLAARFHSRTIVHVHEAPTGLARHLLRFFLLYAKAYTVFNSDASRAAFSPGPKRTRVIYNGFRSSCFPNFSDYDGVRPIRILVVGRLSRGKGQDLLIDAIEALPLDRRERLSVRIVGSSFGNGKYRDHLDDIIRKKELSSKICILPFDPDPSKHYLWSDVVVVPSRVRESFGLVAVEAMAHGKCVIASDQGGLKEVVVDESTGWFFESQSVEHLKSRIVQAMDLPAHVRKMGHAGYLRYWAKFRLETFEREMEALISEVEFRGDD